MTIELSLIIGLLVAIAILLVHKSYEMNKGKVLRSHEMLRKMDGVLQDRVISKKKALSDHSVKVSRNIFYITKKVVHGVVMFVLSYLHDTLVRTMDKMKGRTMNKPSVQKGQVSFFLKHIEEHR